MSYGCLFINNIESDSSMWSDIYEYIEANCNIKLLKYNSKYLNPNNNYLIDCSDNDKIIEEIKEKVQELNTEKVIIISHSAGVIYSMLYASKYPVYALLCLETSVFIDMSKKMLEKYIMNNNKNINNKILFGNKNKLYTAWKNLENVIPDIINSKALQNCYIYHWYTILPNKNTQIEKLNYIKYLSSYRKNKDETAFILHDKISNHYAILDSFSVIKSLVGVINNLV